MGDIPAGFTDLGLDNSGWGVVQALGVYVMQLWAAGVKITDALGEQPTPLLRRAFTLRAKAMRPLPSVCMSDHMLSLGFTKYDTCMQYVMELLAPAGPNIIAAQRGGAYGTVDDNKSMLWLALCIGYVDGSTDVIMSDRSWKVAEGLTHLHDVFGGENYEVSDVTLDWDLPSFDHSAWNMVLVAVPPNGVLCEQGAEVENVVFGGNCSSVQFFSQPVPPSMYELYHLYCCHMPYFFHDFYLYFIEQECNIALTGARTHARRVNYSLMRIVKRCG
ncbi:hypothetical protein DFH07DRAFT_776608 [Mycena maculata]|uniref:Bacterial alpha-L-rhamnosidase N-terminal domain-containing protein n=1 Tax=Mycena maculata TaxID=230809 RepID=A0AAD7IP01_9AGAR|nr:hypothetical protein DFH07DRAFT_776608 [Mycena maculata]